MNASTGSVSEMLSQSIVVLTKPSVASFEQYEHRGGMREALIYVGIAAMLAGLVGFLFGLLGGITSAIAGLLAGVIGPLVGFFVFSYVIFFMGKQQGGTGTQDEVFYSTSLYTAPLLAVIGVVNAIPFLGCLLLPLTFVLGLYQIYLGYLATRASMNLDQTKAIITVVVAYLAQFLLGILLGAILLAIGLGGAALQG